jgi:hypothetical protein
MASGFPGSIDNFTDPLSNSPLTSPNHATLHADVNDAVEKIETYMGLTKVIPTGATNGTVGATGTVSITNGVSSVTVANAFSSRYTNYRIVFSRFQSTNQADVRFALSGYAGNNYYSAKSNINAAGATSTSNVNGTVAYWIVGASDGGDGNIFTMDICGPQVAGRTSFTCTGFGNSGAFFAGGQVVDNAQNTGFTLTLSANTFTNGTSQIIIYGYSN